MTGDPSTALARLDALHTALTQLVLEGGDLARITEEVAGVLSLGVAVTTSDGRVTAAGGMSEEVEGLLVDQDLMDPTGRVRVERGSPEGVGVGSGELRVLRIGAGGADLGRLVCVRADGAIGEYDGHALERVTTVAALIITREQAVAAVEDKYRGDFLRDVFLGRAGDPGYVVEHASSYGWDLTRPVMVVCAELDPVPEEEPVSQTQRRAWQERFSRAWRSVSRDLGAGIPSADFSSEVVTLLPGKPTGLVERAVNEVAGDRGGGRRPFSVGVSRVAPTLTDLPTAYGQARRAVEIGRRVHGARSTTYFDQLGIHRLLALVPESGEIRAFVRDVLGPLSDDTEEAADLRTTLQVLLDTNFNVAEAARLQFFHYNTMRYRVGKLERLLGPLSRDPHLRLDVAVALRARDVTR